MLLTLMALGVVVMIGLGASGNDCCCGACFYVTLVILAGAGTCKCCCR
jgi:hypothetical protein